MGQVQVVATLISGQVQLHYPFDIFHIKMLVQGKLFDPSWKFSLKTCNNFPTRTLNSKISASNKTDTFQRIKITLS